MRRALAIPALVAVVLAMLVFASVSGAWVVAGNRWPGPTVSVWNETEYRVQVNQAMQAWNAAGAAIRLVPAPSRGNAGRLHLLRRNPRAGAREIGYARRGSHVWLSPGLDRRASTAIAAHELGHVLGLGHETAACAVMNPVIDSGCRGELQAGRLPSVWRCLVQPDDARASSSCTAATLRRNSLQSA